MDHNEISPTDLTNHLCRARLGHCLVKELQEDTQSQLLSGTKQCWGKRNMFQLPSHPTAQKAEGVIGHCVWEPAREVPAGPEEREGCEGLGAVRRRLVN